jgi:hypothetical protein
MRSLPALIGLIALAACSSIDKRALTNFNPQGSTGFVYTAQYGQLFLANDKGAEAQRLGWLDQYVKSNGLCPNGYRIVSRTKQPTNDVMGTLVYKGVCT